MALVGGMLHEQHLQPEHGFFIKNLMVSRSSSNNNINSDSDCNLNNNNRNNRPY